MVLTLNGRILMLCVVVQPILALALRAEPPTVAKEGRANWPQNVVVTVGDIRTRIDGPKLWTLSGIEYQDAVMATEDSAYGTVLVIRHVGHLGTAHFLDVAGKPGEVEKEDVTHLQLFVNDKPLHDVSPTMRLAGDSFRLERTSNIRALELATTINLRNGVLTETARFRVTAPIDLRCAYPWMYAWSAQAAVYVFGDDNGIQKRGAFLQEGKTTSQVVTNANWMAVFDSSNGRGSVCCFLKHPPEAEGSFLLIDAPGVYRKIAAYTLVDRIVPKGFEGTYQSAVGFFTATESDWEARAQRRAAELRAAEQTP